ncbi:V-set and immunoglobulin domain-containing protein 10 isoform X2 [Rhinatrema bivittatum]|uniref:V-set and immunoglobulin domain-containing protein 10 isoform X2 n=1 Tax=Rhinatrema bivittatum TaxID=194408 RepID=UPI00112C1AE8|nr:V-set and immunoglobulin domain-containing protein 10 isoform X2 [Rhinatrema bivittatum]
MQYSCLIQILIQVLTVPKERQDCSALHFLIQGICTKLRLTQITRAEVIVIGEVNGSIILSCNNLTESVENMVWFKDGVLIPILSLGDSRISLVNKSSLQIKELHLQDEGNYTCKEDQATTDHKSQIQLLITNGPDDINATISPARALPNGTLIVMKGSKLEFSCTSLSQPVPHMVWIFRTESATSPELLHEVNSTSISFGLSNMPANYQGNYSCVAQNLLSRRKQTSSLQVLVYYPPKLNPVCWAETSQVGSGLHLICSWPGGYPEPYLQWMDDGESFRPIINVTIATDSLVVKLDSPLLQDGQRFKCLGSHSARDKREEAACTVELTLPFLESQPLRTCFVGENVTLMCQVSGANPAANITWLRNISMAVEEIQQSIKYHIVQNSYVSILTVQNCSQDMDEGYFICKAENAIGVKELNIWLTVIKPSNIVGIVIGLVLLFLLVVGIVTTVILYYNPYLYIKGNILRSPGAGDMLVLVDSENEEEMEEVTTAVDSQASDIGSAENGIILHKALYHCTPEGYNIELHSDASLEEENPKPDI